jgi:predicted ArsR family transcriptional regulator
MTTLQQQARALGDPTRHSIFRYIADSDRPTDVTEMTAHFELNHNAIRQHLAKLVDAGLVAESTAKTGGRGRPRLEYVVDPTADGRWGMTSAYERLSVLLTEMIHNGESPVEAGARAGRHHQVEASSPEQGLGGITAAMARYGFDPEVRQRRDRTEIVLRNCPFESAALTDPDTVCSLHLGIARGLAEGTPLVVEDLIRRDPRRANCLLRLSVEEDANSDASLVRAQTRPAGASSISRS